MNTAERLVSYEQRRHGATPTPGQLRRLRKKGNKRGDLCGLPAPSDPREWCYLPYGHIHDDVIPGQPGRHLCESPTEIWDEYNIYPVDRPSYGDTFAY